MRWTVVALLALALFLTGLGAPLLEPQEARYAQIGRETLAGHWLVPHWLGRPYLDKPPLLYWMAAASFWTFGENDAAARLPSAVCALLTVLVVALWARRVADDRTALLAAVVLLLTPKFTYMARLLVFDGPLTLFTTAALAAGHVALCVRSPRWWCASALAAGFGVLVKGPVAIALVVVPLFAWSWLDRGLQRSGWKWWLLWTLLALAPAAPWFLAVEVRQPGFLADFFWHHHVERFATPFDHEEPVWFYLPHVLLGSLPWALFLPGAIRSMKMNANVRCCGLAALWCVLLFSAAGCKRASYILPLFPPLALCVSGYLAEWSREPQRVQRLHWLTVTTAALMIAAVSLAWPWYARRFSLAELARAVDGPVVCSPRLWDSVPYYARGEVSVRGADGLNDLAAGTVLFLPERLTPPANTRPLGSRCGVAAYRIEAGGPVTARR